MKDCPTCQTPRDLSEFARNRTRADGLHGECKLCHRDRQADYYWRNVERERKRCRDYYHRTKATR